MPRLTMRKDWTLRKNAIYSQAALKPSTKTSLFPAKRHHLRQHFSLREKPLKTFAYGKSHAVRVRFLPVTPAGVQPSGMLGRAINAKHLRPGLPVRQHFSRCEKPPFGCPAFLPVPPSLPLGKRLRIFAFDPRQKTSFFGDPGAKTAQAPPTACNGYLPLCRRVPIVGSLPCSKNSTFYWDTFKTA